MKPKFVPLEVKARFDLVVWGDLAGEVYIDGGKVEGIALYKFVEDVAFIANEKSIGISYSGGGIPIPTVEKPLPVETRVAPGAAVVSEAVEVGAIARFELVVEGVDGVGDKGFGTDQIG